MSKITSVSLGVLVVILLLFFSVGVQDYLIGKKHYEQASIITGEEIASVIDCETLKTASRGDRVKLFGIRCGEDNAKAEIFLENLFNENGKMVRLEFAEPKRDKQGNLVATAHIVQKKDIAEPPYFEYVPILNINDSLVTNGFAERIIE